MAERDEDPATESHREESAHLGSMNENTNPTITDRDRTIDAIEFYLDRARWGTGDPEKAEYERLLADLKEPLAREALMDALANALREGGLEDEWADYTADTYIEYVGYPDSDMTDQVQAGFVAYLVDDALDLEFARRLVAVLEVSLAKISKERTW